SVALKRLSDWLPDLGLHRLRRVQGRMNYEAVATWRESTTGKTLSERSPNLKMSALKGIVDFGDNRTYSSLDLVMAARGCSLGDAYDWLHERVGKKNGPEVDFEALGRNNEAPGADEAPGTESFAEGPQQKTKGARKCRFKLISFKEMRPGLEQPY